MGSDEGGKKKEERGEWGIVSDKWLMDYRGRRKRKEGNSEGALVKRDVEIRVARLWTARENLTPKEFEREIICKITQRY